MLQPGMVRGWVFWYEGFYYTTNDGVITITGYDGDSEGGTVTGTVTVPSTIDGLPVTSIGDRSFIDNSTLTNITLPNSLTNIGDGAFHFCTSLTNIVVPNGVTKIGRNAFFNCSSLSCATLPDTVLSIGEQAFFPCFSLTNVTIPNNLRYNRGLCLLLLHPADHCHPSRQRCQYGNQCFL